MLKRPGNTLIETCLIVSLIFIACFIAITYLGDSVHNLFIQTSDNFDKVNKNSNNSLLISQDKDESTLDSSYIPAGYDEGTYDDYLDNLYENQEDLEDTLGDEAYYKYLLEKYKNSNTAITNTPQNSTIAINNPFVMPTSSQSAETTTTTKVLTGTEGNDTLNGNGYTEVKGLAGNDNIYGGILGSTLLGNAGNDQIYAGKRDDKIDGGDGNDKIVGGRGHDIIFGNSGNDLIYGGNGDDTISGGDGNDIIYGGKGNDMIAGNYYGTYKDTEYDIVYAGKGTDTLAVTYTSTVYGGKNSDIINVQLGATMDNKIVTIYGDSGSDSITIDTKGATNSTFYVSSGSGKDKVIYNGSLSNATLYKSSKDGYVYIVETSTNNKIVLRDLKFSRDEFYIGNEKIKNIPLK